MSGIETLRTIIEAEKEAARIVEDAKTKASEIRRSLESLIQSEREEILGSARKEAAKLIENAEKSGRLEAEAYEKESQARIRSIINKASVKKASAVEKLAGMIVEAKR